MNWVIVLWLMIASACLTLAFIHLLIWFKQRAQYAHLLYGAFALGVACFAAFELLMMRAESVEQFRLLQRWIHVPIFILIVSSVWFVRIFFGTGRLWFAVAVIGLRLLVLVVNFSSATSINYLEITALRPVELWGGATVPVAETVVNPWGWVGGLTLLLWGVFVADATLLLWARGGPDNRRRAGLVGGSLIFLVVAGAVQSQLMHQGIVKLPHLMTWLILGPLLAMGYELGSDVFRAAQLARKVQAGEAQLQMNAERLRLALTGARLALWDWDIANGEVYLSDRWQEMLGGAPQAAITTFAELAGLVHSDDFPVLRRHLREALKGAVPAYEVDHRVRTLSGDWLWIHSRGEVVVRDSSGRALRMTGVNEDITGRKQAEDALRRSEERLRLSQQVARVGTFDWDIATGVNVWTPEMEAVYGLPPGGFAKTRSAWESLVHPDDRARAVQKVNVTLQTGQRVEGEWRVIWPDGSIHWLSGRFQVFKDEAGKPVRMTGVNIDITDRKQAEERFRLVVEASPNAMIIVNGKGEIVLLNPQAEKIFGYAQDELVNCSIEVLIPERFRAAHRDDRSEYFRSASGRMMGAGRDLYARRRDGSEVPVEIGLAPIATPEGTLILASIIDITERRQIESEAAAAHDELAHLSRVAMLGELSGSLAHELNQPLAAILSNAQAAQRVLGHGTENVAEVREILKDIVEDDKRAGEVIRRLRVLLKKEDVELHSLDINEIVLDVLRLMRSDLLNRIVTASTGLASDLPAVRGDRIQLQQVLLNLVINACDAMIGSPARDRQLDVRTLLVDGHVEVCVADHGKGIPPEDLERIFQPFVTTKLHGIGLGLAVCRTIVNAHAGRIWATNNGTRGATVHFALPVSPPRNA